MEARRKEQSLLRSKPLITSKSKKLIKEKKSHSTIDLRNGRKLNSNIKRKKSENPLHKSELVKTPRFKNNDESFKRLTMRKNSYSKLNESTEDIEIRSKCTFRPVINNSSIFDKSKTNNYVRRKNGNEKIDSKKEIKLN